jgi:hypothetical protein
MSGQDKTPAAPQWTAPSRIKDPLVRRLFIDRAAWNRALRGRIPKIQDRAVAQALATYGNKDGSSNYPGVSRLVEDLFLSESTVKRSLSWLAEHGWITRTERGDRWAGKSDVFHLALPAPVAAELGLWFTASNGEQWMERPPSEPKRKGVRERPEPERQGRQGVRSGPGDRCPEAEIGVCKDGDRCPSLDLPPEPGHQSLSLHHSALPARPAADASSRDDLEGDTQGQRIVDAIEAMTGRPLSDTGHWRIDELLTAGAHPRIVTAAVLADEQPVQTTA